MVDAVPSRQAMLPAPRTRLVGRESERAAAQTYLLTNTVPLLTLTGPGGVGKTRLAMQIASDIELAYDDGVVFVPFASVRDPGLVVSTLAQVLQVRESPGVSSLEVLTDALRDRHMLVVLDNLEHLLPVGPSLAHLLRACPRMQLLVTSREHLHLDLEQVYPIFPLPTPDLSALATPASLLTNPAVTLFIERSQQLTPHMELGQNQALAVATIVQRLDGLPLAIELAAARTPVLSLDALMTRLDHRLPLLTDGPTNAPERLRTMRNAIAWSYELLPPETQRLFRRLAVFTGGCTLHAAESVAAAEGDILGLLTQLIASSLMHTAVEEHGSQRYTMLETLREFGLEQLQATGEWQDARARHASYFLTYVEHALPDPPLPGERHRIAAIQSDYDNIRMALDWFARSQRGVDLARLTGPLFDFWYSQGLYHEGREWSHLALGYDNLPVPVRLRALGTAGALALVAGDLPEAARLGKEELPLARASGDEHRLIIALFNAALLDLEEGRFAAAEQAMRDAYELACGWGQAPSSRSIAGVALNNLGVMALAQGHLDRARPLLEQAISGLRAIDYPWALADALWGLGAIHLREGRYHEALIVYTDALKHARQAKDPRPLAAILLGITGVATATGHLEAAAYLFGITEAVVARFHVPFPVTDLVLRDQILSRLVEQQDGSVISAARSRGAAVLPTQAAETAAALLHDLLDEESSAVSNAAGLTPREREILRWLEHGWSDRQIAEELFLSRKTVSNHVANILAKLGAQSRQHAVFSGRQLGLLPASNSDL